MEKFRLILLLLVLGVSNNAFALSEIITQDATLLVGQRHVMVYYQDETDLTNQGFYEIAARDAAAGFVSLFVPFGIHVFKYSYTDVTNNNQGLNQEYALVNVPDEEGLRTYLDEQVSKYGKGKQGRQFSVLFENCSHFASEIFAKGGVRQLDGRPIKEGMPQDLMNTFRKRLEETSLNVTIDTTDPKNLFRRWVGRINSLEPNAPPEYAIVDMNQMTLSQKYYVERSQRISSDSNLRPFTKITYEPLENSHDALETIAATGTQIKQQENEQVEELTQLVYLHQDKEGGVAVSVPLAKKEKAEQHYNFAFTSNGLRLNQHPFLSKRASRTTFKTYPK